MINSILKRYIGISFVVALVSCGDRTEKIPSGHEYATQAAPDGLNRAFAWVPELSGGLGATISQPYQVWIQSQRAGLEAKKLLVFEADKTDGVRLLWMTRSRLEICYAEAQIGQFRNRFLALDTKNQRVVDEIEIVLKRVQKLTDC